MADTFLQHSFLCHHGILGMKWGVRRYQNKDGSLTSAGRDRYGYGSSKTQATIKTSLNNKHEKPKRGTPEYNSFIKKNAEILNKGLKKMSDIGMYNDTSAMKNPKTKREWRDAADLGLKVYENNGELNLKNISDKERDSLRNWFIYEDQTIGRPEIAAMVNRGYKNEEIKRLLNVAANTGSYGDDVDINSNFGEAFRFGAKEGYKLEEFIDDCFNAKKQHYSNPFKENPNLENTYDKMMAAQLKMQKSVMMPGKYNITEAKQEYVNAYKEYINELSKGSSTISKLSNTLSPLNKGLIDAYASMPIEKLFK